MNLTDTLFNSVWTRDLGFTLLHFLWEGALVGVLYAVLRYLLRGGSPAMRYHLAMATLAVMITLPVLTFLQLAHMAAGMTEGTSTQTLVTVTTTGIVRAASTPLPLFGHLKILLQPLVPWAVPLWLLGVVFMTLRVGRGWQHARYLRKTADFPPLPEWHTVIASLRTLLGIRKLVQLAVSRNITVPSVIGWLKPLILIPPSAIAGLTPLQMELILAHELAHIRRQDYLWNLLQVAVETLLFYHPAVRWVSHQARLEREQCCDDMVVEMHGNTIEYARALTELESLRHPRNALLLGANGGQVLNRIYRLLGQPATNSLASWLPMLLVAGLLFAGGLMSVVQRQTHLQAALATRYTFMGKPEPVISRPESRTVAIIPTRIIPMESTQHALQPVPALLDSSDISSLSDLPFLTTPIPPVKSSAVEHAAAHATPAPERAGGQVIAQYSPTYPSLALERGVEGAATVEFTLTPVAEITDLQVTRATGSRLFGQAAMDAIRRWKFTPVTVGGVSESQHMAIEFVFKLNGSATSGGPCKIPMGYHLCTD